MRRRPIARSVHSAFPSHTLIHSLLWPSSWLPFQFWARRRADACKRERRGRNKRGGGWRRWRRFCCNPCTLLDRGHILRLMSVRCGVRRRLRGRQNRRHANSLRAAPPAGVLIPLPPARAPTCAASSVTRTTMKRHMGDGWDAQKDAFSLIVAERRQGETALHTKTLPSLPRTLVSTVGRQSAGHARCPLFWRVGSIAERDCNNRDHFFFNVDRPSLYCSCFLLLLFSRTASWAAGTATSSCWTRSSCSTTAPAAARPGSGGRFGCCYCCCFAGRCCFAAGCRSSFGRRPERGRGKRGDKERRRVNV